MSHSIHGPVQAEGLADGCERCAEIAANPASSLDDAALRPIVERAVDRTIPARSDAEAFASAQVLTTLERAGRLASTCPDLVFGYLREHWHAEPDAPPSE